MALNAHESQYRLHTSKLDQAERQPSWNAPNAAFVDIQV